MSPLLRRSLVALIAVFSFFPPAFGQARRPAQGEASNKDDAVVKVTTNLVQLDVAVVDKNGKPVTDLRAEDFEIFDDERKRTITNFSYIKLQPDAASESITPAEKKGKFDKNAPPPPLPPARLRPEQVRRTFAFVVDDLGLSFEDVFRARDILKKFVNEKMQPNDLVAIIRTGGGSGTLQQFTSDRRLLYAAIDRVRWNLYGRGGISSTSAIDDQTANSLPSGSFESNQAAALDPAAPPGKDAGNRNDELDKVRRQFLTVGTLGALKYIIDGMRELPGRKAIVLISDGFRIPSKSENQEIGNPVVEYLNALTEQANRASVVIYSIDGRGLQSLGLRAEDSISSEIMVQTENGPQLLSGGQILQDKILSSLDSRRDFNFETQSGLKYLANRTGGFFTTDLNAGISRIADDQKGFYLIGYEPDEEEFSTRRARRTFHKLSVKVKRPGVYVRSRAGFFGITDEAAEERSRARGEKIVSALNSPFSAVDVPVRLTALYSQDEKDGPLLRSLMHIDASKLTFVDEPDGCHKAIFDLVAVTYGENGLAAEQVSKTHTIRVCGGTYKRVLKDGFAYIFNVPLKQPGAFQVRAAVRDTASDRVGSASQFVSVPDIKDERLVLSGIVVTSIETPDRRRESAEESAVAQSLVPALRRLRQGGMLGYGYQIYNAQIDRETLRPRLKTQTRLYRNGREIFAGDPQALDASNQKDLKRISAGGRLVLGIEQLPPGEYVLQVEVTDELAKGNRRIARQFIDFEIVE